MTPQKQAELIATACRKAGLDGHIKWIEKKAHAQTWAERIAERFRGGRQLPVKNSYMYCDTLDMSFFYGETGTPYDIRRVCYHRQQRHHRRKAP